MDRHDAGTDARPTGWRRTAIVLTALFLLDVVCAGQGLVSVAVSLVGLVVLVPGALWASLRGRPAISLSRLVRAAIYVLLGLATAEAMRFHAATAEKRAARIIDACNAYKQEHGRLPQRLQDLVPRFLPSVPRAKYTAAWADFQYLVTGPDSHTLMYVALPPFGRRLYRFESGRWSAID